MAAKTRVSADVRPVSSPSPKETHQGPDDEGSMTVQPVSLALLQRHDSLKPRAQDSQTTITSYCEILEKGGLLHRPLVIQTDNGSLLVADGWHVVLAKRMWQAKEEKAGRPVTSNEIEVEVRPGTAQDAFRLGLERNGKHGLSLSNKDKKHAVLVMLADPEWRGWSDGQIASLCQCSDRFVAGIREEIGAVSSTRRGKDGRACGRCRRRPLPGRPRRRARRPRTVRGRTGRPRR